MPPLRELKRRLFVSLAVFLGTWTLRLLGSTWRVRSDGADLPREWRRDGRRYVGVFWHNRILGCCWHFRGMGNTTLISRHHDGEIIARIAESLGHKAARGSSSRGGVAGLKALIDAAREGDVGVTPDGPRGPCYHASAGALEVATRAGSPLILATWAASRAWRVPSWDRFIVPKPFSRITFRYREMAVEEGLDDAGMEEARARLERGLRALTREVEDAVHGGHDERLDDETASAAREQDREEQPGAEGTTPRERRRHRLGRARAAALLIAPALLTGLLPRCLRGEGEADVRAELACALLLASALACALPPALAAAIPAALPRALAIALLLLGLALGALAAAAPGGASLLGAGCLGLLYPLALALLGVALHAHLRPARAAPLLAALPGLLLMGSISLVGPLLTLLPDPGEGLALLLRASAVTALTGSLLDIDVLRSAPLYQLVRAGSEAPFRYPAYGSALATPASLALLAWALLPLRGDAPAAPVRTAAERAP